MKSGFTLIELLVVLVIISLVSAFVVPRMFAPMGGLNLKTAAKKIAGILRYTRSQAASDKIERIGAFDFDTRRVSIFSVPAKDTADEEKAAAEPHPDMVYDLPEDVRFEKAASGEIEVREGVFKIVFFPNGSTSGGEIVLANASGRKYIITVDFITGIVTLSEPNRS